jgi:hypothetical protein
MLRKEFYNRLAGNQQILVHDPEKCAAVFGQDHAQTKDMLQQQFA